MMVFITRSSIYYSRNFKKILDDEIFIVDTRTRKNFC